MSGRTGGTIPGGQPAIIYNGLPIAFGYDIYRFKAFPLLDEKMIQEFFQNTIDECMLYLLSNGKWLTSFSDYLGSKELKL